MYSTLAISVERYLAVVHPFAKFRSEKSINIQTPFFYLCNYFFFQNIECFKITINILMNSSKSLKESFIYNFISWTSMFRITCINDFPILWKTFLSYMTYWSFSLDAIHYGKWVIPSNKKMNITSTTSAFRSKSNYSQVN